MVGLTSLKKEISYASGGILSKQLTTAPALEMTLFCMASGTAISELQLRGRALFLW